MSKRPILMIGAGGHAKVVLNAALRAGFTIAGACDPRLTGGSILGVPVLGGDDVAEQAGPSRYCLINGIGGENPALRNRIFDRFHALGFEFPAIIDPSALIGPEVLIGPGAQVIMGSIIQTGCRIGAGSVLNTGCRLDHDCVLEDRVDIAPGVILCGGVHVAAGAKLGAGVVVLPGRKIGAGVIAGAGAVITRDIPALQTVMGIPARAKTSDTEPRKP